MLDLLITSGSVVDGGASARPRRADVAVHGDRIVDVGLLPGASAERVIDADGAMVVPGFIDPHSHSDVTILANPTAQSTIRQGVTTEIVGNCGRSPAPLSDTGAASLALELAGYGYRGPIGWRSCAELLAEVAAVGTSSNLAWLVGHSTIRTTAGVGTGTPSSGQLITMKHLLEEALDAGMLGLSSGLEYGSGRAARTEELVELAGVLAQRGRLYASHIRNRDAELLDAVDEFFTVARAAGHQAQLSHLNVRHDTNAPPDGWRRAVDRLARERDAGMPVLADMTPHTDGIGSPTGILPAWLLTDGPARVAERLRDHAVRERVRADSDRYWRFVHKGQWDRVTVLSSPATPQFQGLTVPEIARHQGRDPWDAYFDLLVAAGPELDAIVLLARLFTEDHLAEAIGHPLFCLGVDAFTTTIEPLLAAHTPHPLFYSGTVQFLTHHVRTGTLTFEIAVHKLTGMVADQFALRGRGRVLPGYRADLAVIDLDRLASTSTITQPYAYPTGIDHVLVNGVPVISDGDHTGARPGRIITAP